MDFGLVGRMGGALILAVFGLITGSFLNVCIYRIPLGISVASGNHGRSMCTTCGHDLKWYDLVPLFSYLFLKGKCRYCKEKISFRYPVVELLNCILWGVAAFTFGLGLQAVLYALFFSVLIVISGIDWETQEIPYCLELAVAVIAIASLAVPGFPGLKERIIGMLIISVPLAVGALFGAFGGGDVQLMFVSGFLLGWKCMIVAIFVAVFAGGIHAVIVMKKKDADKRMPFGPYLALGMVAAVLYGNGILNWYLGLF